MERHDVPPAFTQMICQQGGSARLARGAWAVLVGQMTTTDLFHLNQLWQGDTAGSLPYIRERFSPRAVLEALEAGAPPSGVARDRALVTLEHNLLHNTRRDGGWYQEPN